jgi:hypothetical protein
MLSELTIAPTVRSSSARELREQPQNHWRASCGLQESRKGMVAELRRRWQGVDDDGVLVAEQW